MQNLLLCQFILNRILAYIIYTAMRTCEAFIKDHLKLFHSPSQWILATRNDQTVVINTFSLDEFHPYRLVASQHRKQCSVYEARQQYALPNTPKIILPPKSCSSQSEVLLLAQRGQFQFSKLASHFNNTPRGHIELALQIVMIAEMLHKKYGYFKFTDKMIRASKGPFLLVWISENEAQNQPQFPIQPIQRINLATNQSSNEQDPLKEMIGSLLKILAREIATTTINDILREQQQNLSFESVKKSLQQSVKEKLFSHCTIISSEGDKYRRFTQEKRRKIPEFLLNKTNLKQKEKQTGSHLHPANMKSALTYAAEWRKESKVQQGSGKRVQAGEQSALAEADRKQILLSLLKKNIDNNFLKETLENTASLSEESMKVEYLQVTPPCQNSPENKRLIVRKDEKLVRESGKSVSTSSANYFSINSSGKRFHMTSTMDNDEAWKGNTISKNKYMNSDFIYPKKNKLSKKDRSSFYKEALRPEVRVSKIIEQKNEDFHFQSQSQSQSGRSPRSPSILQTLGYNQIVTQQSLASPGSEFYKDVSNLLHSGAISRKLSAQIDNTIEGQLNNILFD